MVSTTIESKPRFKDLTDKQSSLTDFGFTVDTPKAKPKPKPKTTRYRSIGHNLGQNTILDILMACAKEHDFR